MNAYLVDAGEVYVCQEYLGELGSIYGVYYRSEGAEKKT